MIQNEEIQISTNWDTERIVKRYEDVIFVPFGIPHLYRDMSYVKVKVQKMSQFNSITMTCVTCH